MMASGWGRSSQLARMPCPLQCASGAKSGAGTPLCPCPAGLAVNCVEAATTSLVSLLALVGWQWHPALVFAFWLTYSFIEMAFLSSNMEKVRGGRGCWYW